MRMLLLNKFTQRKLNKYGYNLGETRTFVYAGASWGASIGIDRYKLVITGSNFTFYLRKFNKSIHRGLITLFRLQAREIYIPGYGIISRKSWPDQKKHYKKFHAVRCSAEKNNVRNSILSMATFTEMTA